MAKKITSDAAETPASTENNAYDPLAISSGLSGLAALSSYMEDTGPTFYLSALAFTSTLGLLAAQKYPEKTASVANFVGHHASTAYDKISKSDAFNNAREYVTDNASTLFNTAQAKYAELTAKNEAEQPAPAKGLK